MRRDILRRLDIDVTAAATPKCQTKGTSEYKSLSYMASSMVFLGLVVANMRIEYILTVTIIASAWIVHNDPVMCMVAGIFMLSLMLLALTHDSTQAECTSIALATILSCTLTYKSPLIGIITFVYPTVLAQNLYTKLMDKKACAEAKEDPPVPSPSVFEKIDSVISDEVTTVEALD